MTAAAAALLLLLAARPAAATDVYINLAGKSGDANLMSLAFPPFTAEDPAHPQDAVTAHRLQEIVRADLLLSRYFKLIESDALSADWKAQGAGWLLAAKVSQNADMLSLTVKLTDLGSGDVIFQRYYRQNTAYTRALAHKLSDDLVHALTGKEGMAQTQIAFANDATGHKEIYVMDYDGERLAPVTHDHSISILPRFAPDRKHIAYTSYKAGNPDLFLINLERGQTSVLSNDSGLNVAGGFSPDGKELLMTLSRQKSPNIYLKNFASGSVTQLTHHFGADSSPTVSPGGQVAFVSDRAGNPQIFILDMKTSHARKITNLNWCDSPAWSPTGEWIAFSGRAAATDPLDIFLVDVTGTQVRRLTQGEGANENPSWSPDGRFLIFTTTRGGRSEIYMMDADGSAPHRLATIPGNSYAPNWSHVSNQ